MAVVSVLAKSARQATMYAVIAWILVSITIGVVQSRFGAVPVLDWVLPGVAGCGFTEVAGPENTQPCAGTNRPHTGAAGHRLVRHAAV